MTDKAVKATRTELISRLESTTVEALKAQGVDLDQVVVLSGRDIMKITAIACEKVMEGMVNNLINIVKGEAYTEYIVGQVCEELDADPKQMAAMSREIARLDRELRSHKLLIDAILDSEDNDSATTIQTPTQLADTHTGC